MRFILTAATHSSRPSRQAIRHHMNHGNPVGLTSPPLQTGPRPPLQLGFDSAKATQNILRLLETSHGSSHNVMMMHHNSMTHWHPTAKRFTYNTDNGWMCTSMNDGEYNTTQDDDHHHHNTTTKSSCTTIPQLDFLNFSDDRTALAKLRGADGKQRYVSMLRLDPSSPSADNSKNAHHAVHVNDGWCIVREVVEGNNSTTMKRQNDTSWITTLPSALYDYLSIEHGGGLTDSNKARELFDPEASLTSVGIASLDDPSNDWSSPSGSILNISLNTYLKGVETQTPHGEESKVYDAIVQLDTIASLAAAATIHVGNGACDTLFVDHLLLGYHEDRWRILGKVFSCRPYPK